MYSEDIVIEKLLEQRDVNLNMLKHLDFEMMMEPTTNEKIKIQKLQKNTISKLKKIEQEIAFLTSKKHSIQ
ncbi:hypothetical protein [Nitrosopumilus sp.]|uniref:hypothetical protein n=1 Tax=Nitrosopumilus sp. TaxID=2024843 RepID=UPI00247E4E45|nr:hypothetical protein [Nitrosopumilus sp.]MCV0430057.1 hypothetical protein [Nitrosopumilus sp.]